MQTQLPFVIFKEVASVADPATGMFRCRFYAASELHSWPDAGIEEHVSRRQRECANPFGFERVNRETWEAARRLEMNGWCETSDVDAFPYAQPLSPDELAKVSAQ